MSRIGSKPIVIREGVTVNLKDNVLTVSSNGKSQDITIKKPLSVKISDNEIAIERNSDEKFTKSLHGTIRSLIENAVRGVTDGYQKDLVLTGVGYRAQVDGDKLILKLGYSHDIEVVAPDGVEFEVKKNIVSVKGHDKQRVGQVAAQIREARKPEPYKGRGVKYKGEHIIRKVGKTVKSTTPGA